MICAKAYMMYVNAMGSKHTVCSGHGVHCRRMRISHCYKVFFRRRLDPSFRPFSDSPGSCRARRNVFAMRCIDVTAVHADEALSRVPVHGTVRTYETRCGCLCICLCFKFPGVCFCQELANLNDTE